MAIYCHIKKNFGSFVTKENTEERKWKKMYFKCLILLSMLD